MFKMSNTKNIKSFNFEMQKFEKEIDLMKTKFFHTINFSYLFTTSGQSLLIDYLQKIQIAIRKWFLHLNEETYEGGWKDLKPDSPDSAIPAEMATSETSSEDTDWIIMENRHLGNFATLQWWVFLLFLFLFRYFPGVAMETAE